MYVRIRQNGKIQVVSGLSKLTTVNAFRKEVQAKTGVTPKLQRLFYMGKQLEDNYTLFDYDLKLNGIIEVSERVVLPEPVKKKEEESACKAEDGVANSEEEVSDKENDGGNASPTKGKDVKEAPPGAEQPAKDRDQVSEAAVKDGSSEADEGSSSSSANDARPADTADNSSNPEQAIRIEDIYAGDPNDLKEEGYNCKRCKNDPNKACKECGCNECGLKDRDEDTLICDECEYYYHKDCLDPPLEVIPDGDWYCPTCRNDEDEIVKPGALLKASKKKAKMPSAFKCKRDWGNGMATVGRSKSCTKVPSNHFGPIPGVDVGMTWKYRMQLSEEGVHRPPVAGIAGRPTEGAMSIVLAGGYEDDVDDGEEFLYTGSGGRDLSGNKRTSEQAFDQELTKMNLAIAVSCAAKVNKDEGAEAKDWKKGKPIRVVRTEKLKKHSKYAPDEGCRYDGLYKVVKYWPEKGRAGFIVWRYLFRRDDDTPGPWTEEGRTLCENNGYTCIYPDNYEEAQKAKAEAQKAKLANKKGKKRKAGSAGEADSGLEDAFQMAKKKQKTTAFKIPANIQELIQKDGVNAKMWGELKDKPMTTRLEFTDLVEEYFNCAICQCLITDPITTVCKHNMCWDCLRRLIRQDSPCCPNCRTNLKGENNPRNPELKAVLQKIFPGYDSSYKPTTEKSEGDDSDAEEEAMA